MVGYVILASNLYLVAVVDDEHFFFFFNGCRVPNIILEQCNKPYPYFSPPSGCFKSSIVIHIEAISKEPDWTGVKKKYCIKMRVCYRKHPSDHHSGVPCVHECHVSLIPNPASSRHSLISRLSRLMLSTSSRHTAFINHIISPPTHHR